MICSMEYATYGKHVPHGMDHGSPWVHGVYHGTFQGTFT